MEFSDMEYRIFDMAVLYREKGWTSLASSQNMKNFVWPQADIRKVQDFKMKSVETACTVLAQNEKVQFGIFGLIGRSDYFPPRLFLNEFFMMGNDPCDQDQRMEQWNAFELNFDEYEEVRRWWLSEHPGAIKELPDMSCWADWVHEIIESI